MTCSHANPPKLKASADPAASFDEFQELVTTFGNVTTIAGIHLANTTNADGFDTNE